MLSSIKREYTISMNIFKVFKGCHQRFLIFTLISKETRDVIFKYGIGLQHEKIEVSMTRDKESTAPSELRISTTLVANNLPQNETQTSIVMVFKNKFGDGNTVSFNFNNNVNHTEDKQAC